MINVSKGKKKNVLQEKNKFIDRKDVNNMNIFQILKRQYYIEFINKQY